MDPITHTIVGLSLTALGGQEVSLTSSATLGVVLGSLAPDFDIIMQVFGDFPYLKHHRGVSHSVPGIFIASVIISVALWLILGGSFGLAFGWTLIGAISHIVLDILNSYGAMFLWPLSKRKYTMNLLVITDPILIGLYTLTILLPNLSRPQELFIFLLSIVYLAFRYAERERVERFVQNRYQQNDPQRVVVTPAMLSLWNWSFFVENQSEIIVGEFKPFSSKIEEKKVLPKQEANEIIEIALDSQLGKFFQGFTPYFYAQHHNEDGNHVVELCDLRYYFRGEFLHNATLVFDEEENLTEAIFQPYSKNRKVPVMS